MHIRQKTAIRYWERRRIVYNLLLTPPALIGWGLGGAVGGAVDDRAIVGIGSLMLLFVFAAICAGRADGVEPIVVKLRPSRKAPSQRGRGLFIDFEGLGPGTSRARPVVVGQEPIRTGQGVVY